MLREPVRAPPVIDRALTGLLLLSLALLPAAATAQSPPVAPRVDFVVKSPQGERVDEYHWLRDDDQKSKRAEVMHYLDAENAYAATVLAPLKPLQEQLLAEMRSRIREDDSTPPAYDHGWWTWRQYDAAAEYPVLMRRRGTAQRPDPQAVDEVLLDVPKMAAGHAYFDIGEVAVSPNGAWLAWSEDRTGRRIHSIRIKHLKSGRVLDERIEGTIGEIVWAADNRTLFYLRQDPVTLQADAVMRHRIDSATPDVEVYREQDKSQFIGIRASASRKYLIIEVGSFDSTETWAIPMRAPSRRAQVVLARRAGVRSYVDHLDGRWVLRTNEGAANFRLVAAAVPERRAGWKDLVPARDDVAVEAFALMHGRVAVQERVLGDSRVRVLGPSDPGLAGGPASSVTLGENLDPAAAHLRYGTTSLVQPAAVWDLDLSTGERLLRKETPVPGYDKALYDTARVWAPAHDGQRIPVTLAWRRDRASRDGRAPLYIEAYGAYGDSFDTDFASHRVSLLDRGFVYAIAHVRGGSELGQAWYEAGRLMHKRNSFSDFVAATDFLVAERWGAADKVFASGKSAGGLLMGVVANEAGDRYKGIALQVPFVDVVTTMLDDTIPLTANEWTQWGDPRQRAAYDYMLSYSPYDNIAARSYPAMLVGTGLWDSQVQYYEPAKYVARLRARKTDSNPLLLHVNMQAGHGGGSGRFEKLTDVAREYAFFIDLAGGR